MVEREENKDGNGGGVRGSMEYVQGSEKRILQRLTV